MKNYYYVINGEQTGPVSLESLINAGITADTLIWCEGMTQWQPASQVAEVAAILSVMTSQQSPRIPQPQTQPPAKIVYRSPYAYSPIQAAPARDAAIVYGLIATIACCVLIPVAQIFM